MEVPVTSDGVEEVEVRIPEALGFHHRQMEEKRGGGSVHQFYSTQIKRIAQRDSTYKVFLCILLSQNVYYF